MSEFTAKIYSIGKELVNCKQHCDGILCDQSKGVIPRCLILETKKREGKNGCVIVGINPGESKEDERQIYLKQNKENRDLYSVVSNYGDKQIYVHPYYKKLRDLTHYMNLDGPILWTELVKCENKTKGILPPLQTFRKCINIFLNEELEAVPEAWPLLAVGRETYKALAYIYSSKTIIGIPHPTSSRGHFQEMIKGNSLKNILSSNENLFFEEYGSIAVWLPDLLK